VADPAGEPPREAGRDIYGLDATGYAAGRPEYPERIFETLARRCGLMPGVAVIESGPGTGQATRRLIQAGVHVTAVEPDPGMADYLRRTYSPRDLELLNATFEEADLPGDGFDLAVAATSFHWVNQEIGIPKLMRILRVGGWIALWWTIFGDPDRDDPFESAVWGLLGETPEQRAQDFRGQLDRATSRAEMFEKEGFADFQCEVFRTTEQMDPTKARAFYGTLFKFLSLDEADRERVLASVEDIATTEFGGVVERPFVTVMYTGRRPKMGDERARG
jgi:SAM-dependent methyltransferase